MAELDVSFVLRDPMFMDTGLGLKRYTQTIGAHGRAVNTAATSTFNAVVTNENGDILRRRAEGEHVVASIVVHSMIKLVAGEPPDITADVVTWHGSEYTVTVASDWSHFGAGFYMAKCDLIPLEGSL